MKISIVCATYNRAELLDRALETYSKQTLPKGEWEYILADDLSSDNTLEVCAKYKDKINLRVLDSLKDLNLPKEPGQWRDGCKVRNVASTFAFGEVLVSTHPEIMIPSNALELAYESAKQNPKAWHTAIPYWLPPCDVDSVDWRSDLRALNTVPGFYSSDWPDPITTPGAPDYRNQNQEIRKDWNSEVWWAMDMGLWRWLGGFRNFERWGSVDMDFWGRRATAKIPTQIIEDGNHSLMVYHQHHDSPRNLEAAMEEVADTDYRDLQTMREQGGLYYLYNHGHRERAVDGFLEGIMHDHIQRYEWVNNNAEKDSVHLDVGCGSGYGLSLLSFRAKCGIDLDAESIAFARTNYRTSFYRVADATELPFFEDSFTSVSCFEVLEHIEDQTKVLSEIYRVLNKGGKLFLSTPQKGATGGTLWDKYMLTHEELLALFDDKWKVEPYYQLRYGTAIIQKGTPPSDAEIQLLIAEKL